VRQCGCAGCGCEGCGCEGCGCEGPTGSSVSAARLSGSMEPSRVVLLNTPLILLPMRPIPNASPRLDAFLRQPEINTPNESSHADPVLFFFFFIVGLCLFL